MIISSVIMISFVAFAPQGSAKTYVNVITASAADSMTKPVLIKRQAYSNKIEAGVKNLATFSSKIQSQSLKNVWRARVQNHRFTKQATRE